MKHFIYMWFDKTRKMYYIGSHSGTEDDGYISTSKWFNYEYKYCPQDFKRRILKYYDDKKEMVKEEYRIIRTFHHTEYGKKYYNLKAGPRKCTPSPLKGTTFTDEHRQKLSEAKANHVPWNKGKTGVQKYDDEYRKKLSEAAKRRWAKEKSS